MAKHKTWTVPHDRWGFPENYPSFNSEQREPYEFTAGLYFDHFERGRSAAHAVFFNSAHDAEYPVRKITHTYEDGDSFTFTEDSHIDWPDNWTQEWANNEAKMPRSRPKYVMFLKELEEHLKEGRPPRIHGRWGFVKRGSNIGIVLLEALT